MLLRLPKAHDFNPGLGLLGGLAAIPTLQFSQTYVRMGEITKKSALVSRPAIYTADLESFFGLQVSICTGIARHVRLRDLVANVLPAYVAGPVAELPL